MKISLHIEREHTCGQLFEEVYTLNGFEMKCSQEWLPYLQDELDLTRPFVLPEPSPKRVEFSGTYEHIGLTGMSWRDHNLWCPRCGEALLFGQEEKGEEDEV